MNTILHKTDVLYKVKGTPPFQGLHDAVVRLVSAEDYPIHNVVEIVECNPESQWYNGQMLYLPECMLVLSDSDEWRKQ